MYRTNISQSVVAATSEYNRESDRFGQFVDECLVEGETLETRTSAVYRVYQQWCSDNGYRAESVRGVNQALGARYSVVQKRPADKSGGPTQIVLGVGLVQGDNLVQEKE